jgi:hypothetical protein
MENDQSAAPLADFVESFWMIANHSGSDHQIVLIPDGRFDIIFSLPIPNGCMNPMR